MTGGVDHIRITCTDSVTDRDMRMRSYSPRVKLGAIGTEPIVPDSSTAAIGENRTSIPPSHLFSTLPPILYPSLVGRVYRRARAGPVAVGTTEVLETFIHIM